MMFLSLLIILKCFLSVKINVMLPLDTVNTDGSLKDQGKLNNDLKILKSEASIDGIMSDVWWGIVQRGGSSSFDWNAYQTIVEIAKNNSLNVQFVMSFHKCGGNTGDACNIPIPGWVLSASGDIFYKDQEGHSDEEYLSLGVDEKKVFSGGRSALDLYRAYMSSFAETFKEYLSDGTIDKIEVGLGPCGEMRYPSYQLDRWKFPGIGEFQAFDENMLSMLKEYAQKEGHPTWTSPPDDAGTYDSFPQNTNFFTNGWKSEYGSFFLTFYSSMLIQHADLILNEARKIFPSTKIAAKISGVHWWHGYDIGAAESCAGYYQTNSHNGYDAIAQLLQKYDAEFIFTCLEMTDQSQEGCSCDSQPEELVELTKSVAKKYGISYSGENALQAYSSAQYSQMLKMANGLESITYLRLCDTLMQSQNLQNFAAFVRSAHSI